MKRRRIEMQIKLNLHSLLGKNDKFDKRLDMFQTKEQHNFSYIVTANDFLLKCQAISETQRATSTTPLLLRD